MSTWFTSDHHFGHENIIKLCGRPFRSVDEMTESMIASWNSVVKTGDAVWHLGDLFSFKPREVDLDAAVKIIYRLNGYIYLVPGNHDVQPWLKSLSLDECSKYVDWQSGAAKLVLCHYPIESWNGKYHGRIHLHGHSHGKLKTIIPRRYDVGVDCNNFTPVSLETILSRANDDPPVVIPKEFPIPKKAPATSTYELGRPVVVNPDPVAPFSHNNTMYQTYVNVGWCRHMLEQVRAAQDVVETTHTGQERAYTALSKIHGILAGILRDGDKIDKD